MKKIWYLLIKEVEEGPYSVSELKVDYRLTPDTLARKEGVKPWKPIRDIPELQDLFEDEDEEEETETAPLTPQDEVALDLQKDPTFIFFWLIIAIIVIFYILYLFS